MGKLLIVVMLAVLSAMPAGYAFSKEAKAVMHVSGMTCNMCQITIRHRVMKMEGVLKAVVDRKTNTARVTFEDTVQSAGAIAGAITELGYPAVLKENASISTQGGTK